MKKGFFLASLMCATLLTGCVTPPPSEPVAISSKGVESILVVPPVNETNTVGADLLMTAVMPYSLSEGLGYYVFPLDTVRMVLENEGYYEPERVQQIEPTQLASMFHADAVLFVKILHWDAAYQVFGTVTSVEVEYKLYHKDGTLLFSGTGTASQDSANNNNGALINMVVAAVNRALPEYESVARYANLNAIRNWEAGVSLVKKH